MLTPVIKIFLVSFMLLITVFASAQNNQFYTITNHEADSLRRIFQKTKNDTLKMSVSKDLARYYLNNRDSSIYFTQQQLALAKLLNQKLWEASALDMSSYLAYDRGDYPNSLKLSFEALAIAEDESCEKNIYAIKKFSKEGNAHKARLYILVGIYEQFAFLYDNSKNNEKTFLNYGKAIEIAESIDDQIDLSNINMNIGKIYLEADKLDSALIFEKKALGNSMAGDFKYYRGYILIQIGQIYFRQKNYAEAKKYFLQSFKISKEENALKDEADAYNSLSTLYAETNQLDSSLFYAKKALKNCLIAGDKNEITRSYDKLFSTYKLLGNTDSAFAYLQLSKTLNDSLNSASQDKINQYQNLNVNTQLDLQEKEKEKILIENRRKIYALLVGLGIFSLIGFILYRNNRQKQKANVVLQNTLTDLKTAQTELENRNREAQIELSLEKVRSRSMAMHQSDELASAASVLFQQIKDLGFEIWSCGFCIWKPDNFSELWMSASSGGLLPPMMMPYKEEPTHHKIYEDSLTGQPNHEYIWEGEELLKHYEFLYTIPSVKEAIDILKKSGLSLPDRQCYYVGYFKQGYLLIITQEHHPEINDLSLRFSKVFEQTYTRFLDLQKAEQLTEQTKLDLIQIQTEKKRAEDALKILKVTQNQLIQSEKLASLGELTAGIAHEIQNPLNFVNNFSELSVDLAKDIKDELHKPQIDKPYVEDLLTDLTANQEKINHHGKRAASIVSGMLEHSRASTGKKELTDINKLADEYFRLSFHGLRAKNKDFNAEMITHFDETIPKIEIIPQDVGRVILNIINNAFYAVNEKRILDNGRRTTNNGNKNIDAEIYSPTVTVTTLKTDNAIEIHVRDNGIGMSEAVRAKIFQPFFTTKPTGQGTGLGLSLAYDIVTKGHGGTLEVESTEGVGTTFIITL